MSRQGVAPGTAQGTATLGLPAGTRACLFDLDGVLTDTARLHAAAWKEVFDAFLRARAQERGTRFVPFGAADYDAHVDGRSRDDGTRSFLRSRGVELPTGHPGDGAVGAGASTVTGIGEVKNAILVRRLRSDGVSPYPGSLRYVREVRSAGLSTAVVSSSANCAEVLAAAGIADLLDARVDGTTVARRHLAGKPAPDTFLAAASVLGVVPGRAAVFEDALAGVAAGRAGGFGFVVGVDRAGRAEQLRAHGADVVVDDLARLLGRAGPR